MKMRSTIKQQELFRADKRPATTLPSRVQIEIVRLLRELILEHRGAITPNTDIEHEGSSR